MLRILGGNTIKTIELINKYEGCSLKKLNSSDYNGDANEFLKWNKSNGKVLNELIRRRQEEKELFLKNNYLSNKSCISVLLVDVLK